MSLHLFQFANQTLDRPPTGNSPSLQRDQTITKNATNTMDAFLSSDDSSSDGSSLPDFDFAGPPFVYGGGAPDVAVTAPDNGFAMVDGPLEIDFNAEFDESMLKLPCELNGTQDSEVAPEQLPNSIYILERAGEYFIDRAKFITSYVYIDVVTWAKLSRAVSGIFFTFQGQEALPGQLSGLKATGLVSICLEDLMPHIQISAHVSPLELRDIQCTDHEHTVLKLLADSLVKDEVSTPGDTADSTQQVSDLVSESQQPLDAFHSPGSSIDHNFEDVYSSFKKSIHTLINYDACEDINIIELHDIHYLSEQAAYNFNVVCSHSFRKHVETILEAGKKPLLVEIKFDPEKAAHQRVFSGVPYWAHTFAGSLRKGIIIVLIQSEEDTLPLLRVMIESFKMSKAHGSPLQIFHRLTGPRLFSETDIGSEILPDMSEYDCKPRQVFFSREEYHTMFGLHVLNEARYIQREAPWIFAEIYHSLSLLPIQGTEQKVYFGFLKIPDDTDLHVSTGMEITVWFETDENYDYWTLQVTSEAITIGPLDYIPLIVNRPWDEESRTFSTRTVSVIDLSGRTLDDIPTLILQDVGNRVQVSIDTHTKATENLIRARTHLNSAFSHEPRTKWNDNIEHALLCSRLTDLVPHDIFQAVRQEFPEPESLMWLNEEQLAAVQGFQQAPGGLMMIQGPSGTGKSAMLRQICTPFLRSVSAHLIVMISSSSLVVDSIADTMTEYLAKLQGRKRAPAARYGLRILGKASEQAIRNLEAVVTRPMPKNCRPAAFAEDFDPSEFERIHQDIVRLYQDETARKFKGFPDKRVYHAHLSAGRKMLEIAGVINGPSTHSERLRFATFRHKYRYFALGHDFWNDDDEADFTKASEDLWTYTLKHASFIVGTTANIGSPRVLEHILEDTRVILVDGAAHQREDHLLPFFSARFRQLDGFIQVGDFLGLQPLVPFRSNACNFAGQMAISLFSRLVTSGFPVHDLKQQYRFVPELAEMINKLTCRNGILTINSERADRRKGGRMFRRLAENKIDKPSNRIFLDIVGCAANDTREDSRKSRYNDLSVILIVGYAIKLVRMNEKAKVVVLTGYKAQKQRYLRAKANALRMGIKGMDRWTVKTFDEAEGEHFMYAIVEILVNNRNPSLGVQSDPHRMNVAMTRATDGIIVAGNWSAIQRMRESWRFEFFGRIVEEFSTVIQKTDRHQTLPACAWYGPQHGQ